MKLSGKVYHNPGRGLTWRGNCWQNTDPVIENVDFQFLCQNCGCDGERTCNMCGQPLCNECQCPDCGPEET